MTKSNLPAGNMISKEKNKDLLEIAKSYFPQVPWGEVVEETEVRIYFLNANWALNERYAIYFTIEDYRSSSIHWKGCFSAYLDLFDIIQEKKVSTIYSREGFTPSEFYHVAFDLKDLSRAFNRGLNCLDKNRSIFEEARDSLYDLQRLHSLLEEESNFELSEYMKGHLIEMNLAFRWEKGCTACGSSTGYKKMRFPYEEGSDSREMLWERWKVLPCVFCNSSGEPGIVSWVPPEPWQDLKDKYRQYCTLLFSEREEDQVWITPKDTHWCTVRINGETVRYDPEWELPEE